MRQPQTGGLQIETRGPPATAVINRPEVRNALDTSTARGLNRAFRGFDEDPESRVAVISDRHPATLQNGLPEREAIRVESECAEEAKALEARNGAARFAPGEERHGSFGES